LANQILSFDGFAATHDDNGNLTTLDADTFTWDVRNRLASLTGSGLSASFQYDPLGRRINKTLNGQPTVYLPDGVNPLQEQATPGGNWTALTMTGLAVDEIIARGDVSGVYYYLPDGLGSTVALTDDTGAIHTQYTYAPFGETTRTGTVGTNPFQFTRRENDNTGLYYYRARYYHPVLQRFLSEDPIEFAGGDVNLYGYVFDDPINFTDPLGLRTFSIGAKATVGLGLGIGGGFTLNFGYSRKVGFSISLTGTVEGGAFAGVGASAQGVFQYTHLDAVCQLEGPFVSLGKSIGVGTVVGGDALFTIEGKPVGFDAFYGKGLRLGALPSSPVATSAFYSETGTVVGFSSSTGLVALTNTSCNTQVNTNSPAPTSNNSGAILGRRK